MHTHLAVNPLSPAPLLLLPPSLLQNMFAHLAAGVEPWFQPAGFWAAFKDYDGQPVNVR